MFGDAEISSEQMKSSVRDRIIEEHDLFMSNHPSKSVGVPTGVDACENIECSTMLSIQKLPTEVSNDDGEKMPIIFSGVVPKLASVIAIPLEECTMYRRNSCRGKEDEEFYTTEFNILQEKLNFGVFTPGKRMFFLELYHDVFALEDEQVNVMMYYLIKKLMYHGPPGVPVKYSCTNIMFDQLFKFAMQRYLDDKNAFQWPSFTDYSEVEYTFVDCPKQDLSRNCGRFVVKFTDMIINGENIMDWDTADVLEYMETWSINMYSHTKNKLDEGYETLPESEGHEYHDHNNMECTFGKKKQGKCSKN
ncbi:hypothetical protein K7X08_025236 [Anisodus acutangulus]|uniref:Ubiquitin-like protease family profile domain-containing protein n=1 Tax=Anisodus acutangulus TaxID=402998 RepID=A0A9Q1RGP4_9SOLA|nr:hypothetical protein K7X08_025236 [Anisodus acutangulus]